MDELEMQYQRQQREWAHFNQWFSMGVERGWITRPFCIGHDEPPLTEYEFRQYMDEDEDSDPPCVLMVRLTLIHEGPRYDTSIDHSDETRPE